jgi:hypothetical protein
MEQRRYTIALEEKVHIQKQNKIFLTIFQVKTAMASLLGKIFGLQ